MRFKRTLKIEHGLSSMDLVPLLNVIMQVMIFFILILPFVVPTSIAVKLPKVVTSGLMHEDNWIITVSNENVVYLNGTLVTFKELKSYLQGADHRFPVLIKVDRRASMGRVLDVWDMCRNIGIEEINVATTQK